ncbi:jg10041 [Pararge aegeria aegeria]|uniref:Jg10041 protein n=1 Tax=Pararge aegeria aegeria TaxID=348720 RepID=A0A8S4SEI7_9NEOP|nr:jg10041 [Pararge aegeria aegeria]
MRLFACKNRVGRKANGDTALKIELSLRARRSDAAGRRRQTCPAHPRPSRVSPIFPKRHLVIPQTVADNNCSLGDKDIMVSVEIPSKALCLIL